jgi:integrase
LKKVLEEWQKHEGCPYVFPNTGTMLPFWSGDKPFANALAKAKITNFHFHDLRHTYASHLVMSGIDLTTVMHLMGHKSIKMTLRYSHLAPSHKANAMLAIEDKFQGIFEDR